MTDGGVGGVALTEGFGTSGGLAMGVFGSGEGGEVVTEVELGSAATGPSTLSSGLSRELSAVTWPGQVLHRGPEFDDFLVLGLARLDQGLGLLLRESRTARRRAPAPQMSQRWWQGSPRRIRPAAPEAR